MKNIIIVLIAVISLNAAFASDAIRFEIKSTLLSENSGGTSRDFQGELLIPQKGKRKIFIAPYTLTINSNIISPGKYNIEIELIGLGPTFHNYSHNFELAVSEKILIPSLPAKNDLLVSYSLTLTDDTSAFKGYATVTEKSPEWGTSTSIHYLTRWMKGSYADFTWNTRLSYLENVYNQYRYSYKLSMFDKIDVTFHPEPTDAVYLDPSRHYAIYPNSKKIDLVFGHDIDAASPAPAAELLIYSLWGYGPRWMVTGLAHLYEDNNLLLRDFAHKLDPSIIKRNFSSGTWVDSDTGTVFCGGFVNWLLTTGSLSDFKNLYKKSTPLDFENRFEKIYDRNFTTAIEDFIEYSKSYIPKEGEQLYFASIYLRQGDFTSARDLFKELVSEKEIKEENLVNLAACQHWTGDFDAAVETYDTVMKNYPENPRYMMLSADVRMAKGDFDKAVELYENAFSKHGFGNAGLRLMTILIDDGRIDSARVIFDKLGTDISGRLDYSIEQARLMIAESVDDLDSLLVRIANRALAATAKASDDPRGYLAAGKALALSGRFDQAVLNLETAHFLERKSSFLGLPLLELGKAADLSEKRDEALEYYRKASESGGGKYIEKLCQKYIKSGYRLKK
ncbi:MAG: tetratricopeptide repeat protein [candidate division Zixibacteria bacterium]